MRLDFCTISIYSHHVEILNPTLHITKCLYRLSHKYTQMKMVKNKRGRGFSLEPDKTYAIYGHRGRMYRLHKNQWPELLHLFQVEGVYQGSYEVLEVPDYTPPEIGLKIREGWQLRDRQPEAREFIRRGETREYNSPLLHIGTGRGKGVMSMVSALDRPGRLAVIVIARFVQKWADELAEIIDVKKNEIACIQGTDALMGLLSMPSSDREMPKIMVFSLNTLQLFYKEYEKSPDNPLLGAYDCRPHEMMEHLGVGTVIYDEVHMHLYAVYHSYAYLHVPKVINLSATIISYDPVIQQVHRMMFPPEHRFVWGIDPYIGVYACSYQIVNFHNGKIKTMERGSSNYSHTAFEDSIMKHKAILEQYKNMIFDGIRNFYLKDMDPRDKCVVFVATKAMARYLKDEGLKAWPNMDIRTYLQENDLPDMIEPQIRFTTIISGGTALDVPNLRVALNTINVKAPAANLQARGRLRDLKDRDVRFYYYYCSTIPKHCEYHRDKVQLYTGSVAYHRHLLLPAIWA